MHTFARVQPPSPAHTRYETVFSGVFLHAAIVLLYVDCPKGQATLGLSDDVLTCA